MSVTASGVPHMMPGWGGDFGRNKVAVMIVDVLEVVEIEHQPEKKRQKVRGV